MEVRAYAKVNLTLEVLDRRGDGYHQVMSILQTVDLWDTLRLEPAPRLELACSVPGLDGPDNLVWRAATRLQQEAGQEYGARISLEKRVPVAMGLGGGSSDAAAALLALDRLWGLGLGKAGLVPIAAELGSDVPFFLVRGTALAEGRGDRVSPLPALSRHWVLLLCPPCAVPDKTAYMYRMLSPEHYSDGSMTRRATKRLEDGQFAADLLYNAFEAMAPLAFDSLYHARQALMEAGVPWAHLCGSGPGLFCLLSSQDEGERALYLLKDAGWEAYLVSTI